MPMKRRTTKRFSHLPAEFDRLIAGENIEYSAEVCEMFCNVDYFGDIIVDGRRIDVDLPDDAIRRMGDLLREWREQQHPGSGLI